MYNFRSGANCKPLEIASSETSCLRYFTIIAKFKKNTVEGKQAVVVEI